MTIDILALIIYLIVIVAASEIFTNAVESAGKGLNLSEGVSGSIFAAVGTALPETMVPLIAVLTGRGEQVNEEVGVGAILGAPFMLSTLAFFLTGAAAWRFGKRRKKASIEPEQGGLRRDLGFFLFSFTLALLVAFAPYEMRLLRVMVALVLISTYVYYLYRTLKASPDLVKEGHHTEARRALYLSVLFREHLLLTLAQMIIGVALIIVGAKGFVRGLEALGRTIHIPIIALSLLIIPIATELPEKINSIIWIRHGKDTMAVGNITGAMVFQGSLLPAIGIFLTPWTINPTVLASGAITIAASLWLFALAHRAKKLRPLHLVANGVLYTLFLAFTISMFFYLSP